MSYIVSSDSKIVLSSGNSYGHVDTSEWHSDFALDITHTVRNLRVDRYVSESGAHEFKMRIEAYLDMNFYHTLHPNNQYGLAHLSGTNATTYYGIATELSIFFDTGQLATLDLRLQGSTVEANVWPQWAAAPAPANDGALILQPGANGGVNVQFPTVTAPAPITQLEKQIERIVKRHIERLKD